MKEEAKEKIEKFKRRISDRKWNSKTVDQYTLWAGRLEKWMDSEDFESYQGVMFDFDTYLADLPEDPPWNGNKGAGGGFSYSSRILKKWGHGKVPVTYRGEISGGEFRPSPDHFLGHTLSI